MFARLPLNSSSINVRNYRQQAVAKDSRTKEKCKNKKNYFVFEKIWRQTNVFFFLNHTFLFSLKLHLNYCFGRVSLILPSILLLLLLSLLVHQRADFNVKFAKKKNNNKEINLKLEKINFERRRERNKSSGQHSVQMYVNNANNNILFSKIAKNC
ncbi:unnamed protein product [Ceratitis capitata]|uniref:(Mediterranean fruit fly) hypothetical protein n=1 Tax=Ceratitis capitata TaxID=7213 RepID=A0A811VID3_CERCA|nr:unnamed protein product [Ceratitis capitata]